MLGDFLSEGVNLYSSTDLTTWAFEGLIFNGTEQMQDMPLGPPFRIERPKVLSPLLMKVFWELSQYVKLLSDGNAMHPICR